MIEITYRARGRWNLRLREPRREVERYGHIVVTHTPVGPERLGDGLLDDALYVGVVLDDGGDTEGAQELAGAGLEWWLGSSGELLEEGVAGPIYETQPLAGSDTFANTIRALLPPTVGEGTLHAVAGTYGPGSHRYQTAREAIDTVVDVFDATWRIRSTAAGAVLDAGTSDQLFGADPVAIYSRDAQGSTDPGGLTGFRGTFTTQRDARDYANRVVVLGEGQGEDALAVGTAEIALVDVPYRDLAGNTVRWTRLVSDARHGEASVDDRAAVELTEAVGSDDRLEMQLHVQDYEVTGPVDVGELIWLYDPVLGITDTTNEVHHHGEVLHPIAVRVVGLTIPVVRGMGVYHRTGDGTWTDLTADVDPEDPGAALIQIGQLARPLTGVMEPTGPRLQDRTGDGQTPAAPPNLVVVGQSNYLNQEGNTRVRATVGWDEPLNTDGSTVLDGNRYEVQWALTGTGNWAATMVGWDNTTATLLGLEPGAGYDLRVRATDTAGNVSAWSAVLAFTAQADVTAPSTPAAPTTVAGNPHEIQVTHDLGVATGGTFNLEEDLDHLEVHVGTVSTFTADATTHVGDLAANAGMLNLSISAVGTFDAAQPTSGDTSRWVRVIAVDRAGNRSGQSAAAAVTATLVDTQHITDLAVTNAKVNDLSAAKVTAGTITGEEIILATGATDGVIRSDNFVAGSAGWRIDSAGDAEFNDATVRGTLISGAESAAHIKIQADLMEFFDAEGNRDLLLTSGAAAQLRLEGDTAELFIVDTFNNIEGVLQANQDAFQVGLADPIGAVPQPMLYGRAGDRVTLYDEAGNTAVDLNSTAWHDIDFAGITRVRIAGDSHEWNRGTGTGGTDGQLIMRIGSDVDATFGEGVAIYEHDGARRRLWFIETTGTLSGRMRLDDWFHYDGLPHISSGNPTMHFRDSDNLVAADLSSRRFKREIHPLTDAEDPRKVLDLVAKRYLPRIREGRKSALVDGEEVAGAGAVRDARDPEQWEVGFIAEEVVEVFPELVGYDADGQPLNVNRDQLVAPLLEVVKDLDQRVATLETQLPGGA